MLGVFSNWDKNRERKEKGRKKEGKKKSAPY